MKAIKPISLIILLLSFTLNSFAQKEAKNQFVTIKKVGTINLSEVKEDWKVNIQNNEMPMPGGDSYKSFLLEQKQKIKPFGNRETVDGGGLDNPWEVDTIIHLDGFVGNDMSSGYSQPNDHSMAISNDGLLITTHNSDIKCINVNNSEVLSNVTLSVFQDTLEGHSHKFDPKVIYDPKSDRFVMVFLNGSTDSTSSIIVCYSQTNDPSKEWNLYSVDGHPFDDGTWSDYPAIALTESDFYLTMNMVHTGVHWKIGFEQTVIYQFSKFDGYQGKDSVTTRLWTDIAHEGRNIRNMHPIKGGSKLYGPNMFFLSNRNFSLSCDSIFIMEITDSCKSASPSIKVNMVQADKPYGLSPDVAKSDRDSSDRYWTNDSRVLGGFLENDQIHFVSNSAVPSSAVSGIYHGIISNISTGAYSIKGMYIGDTIGFGYPNISYAGTSTMNDAMITFLHSWEYTLSGFSAIFYKHNNGYHPRTVLKAGERKAASSIYRWGDYSGSQRMYNNPGVIWCSGSFGKSNSGLSNPNKDATWVASIKSPDMKVIGADIDETKSTDNIKQYPTIGDEMHFVDFNVNERTLLTFTIVDLQGRVVKTLLHDTVKKGSNTFSFNKQFLAEGSYILSISNDKEQLFAEPFIVQ